MVQSEAIVPTRYPKWWTFGTSKTPLWNRQTCMSLLRRPYKPGVKALWRFLTGFPVCFSQNHIVVFSQRLKTVCFQFWRYQKQFLLVIHHCGMIKSEFFFVKGLWMNLNFDLFVLFWTMLHYKAFVELWQRWHNFAREENRKTWNALKGNALKSVCFGGCVVLKITPKKSQPKKVVLKRITSNETNDVHHDFAERVLFATGSGVQLASFWQMNLNEQDPWLHLTVLQYDMIYIDICMTV